MFIVINLEIDMTTETAQQEFDSLRTEMQLGRALYMMPREEAEKLSARWFEGHHIDRAKFMAMIDARERIPPGKAGKLAGMSGAENAAAAWAASNAKLIESRGGRYGLL